MACRLGQKLAVFVEGRNITLVPVPELDDMIGVLKGKTVGEYSDEEDRM